MEDNFVIIKIGNTEYYIQATLLSNLVYIDNKLVNISNSSITLVHSFDINTTYPRITCNAMQQCRLQSNNTSNYSAVNTNYELIGKYNINTLGSINQNNIIIVLLFIIVSLKLLWKR